MFAYKIEKKEFNMQNRIEKGVQIFLDGHLCSQAVLGAFCKDFDLDKDLAFKLSKVLEPEYLEMLKCAVQ